MRRFTGIYIYVVFLALLTSATLPVHGRSNRPGAEAAQVAAVSSYVQDLELILDIAKETYGVDEIFVGGGTARSLIQHVLLGTPFTFRDFDIVLSANKEVTAENARALGVALESRGLGRFSEENLRPRPRTNPAQPIVQGKKYNAGFGFFVMNEQSTEYDISVFHSIEAMELNGILDVDKIRVALTRDQSVAEILTSKEKLRAAIRDPENALPAVLEGGAPKVVNWPEVESDPTNVAIRIVRGLTKFDALPVDEITAERIRSYIQADKKGNPLQMSRNLLKLLDDRDWLNEFTTLVELGLFTHHFRSFINALEKPEFVNSKNSLERVTHLLLAADKADYIRYLKLLADLEPEIVQNVLPKLVVERDLKVGYFTGEFAPFHNGHMGVARTALVSGGFDLVFVIPTPHATNDPKTERYSRAEWEERRAFVKAGLKEESRAWLWPFSTKESGTEKLADQIESLEKFIGSDKPATHIFGMDSFHRVLYRNLLNTSVRPRIAVTRPGVPFPERGSDSNVQIFENVVSDPISATRILHELAMTGDSKDLFPEVVKAVLATPRYIEILQKFRELRDLAEASIRPIDQIASKILTWDPRENHAGLYQAKVPEFNSTHAAVIEGLVAFGADNLVVYMEDDASARESWLNMATRLNIKYQGRMRIVVSNDYRHVARTDRVTVLHSGRANETLKGNRY